MAIAITELFRNEKITLYVFPSEIPREKSSGAFECLLASNFISKNLASTCTRRIEFSEKCNIVMPRVCQTRLEVAGRRKNDQRVYSSGQTCSRISAFFSSFQGPNWAWCYASRRQTRKKSKGPNRCGEIWNVRVVKTSRIFPAFFVSYPFIWTRRVGSRCLGSRVLRKPGGIIPSACVNNGTLSWAQI